MMHCGTTKAQFYRGETNGYEWLDIGSQYVMSEHQAKVLIEQLHRLEEITAHRRYIWSMYEGSCNNIHRAKKIGNGHIFWWLRHDKWPFIAEKKEAGIKISSHYDALHMTIPGRKYGRAGGVIKNAVHAMENLVKLDTSVSEDRALITCEVLWPLNTAVTHSIL